MEFASKGISWAERVLHKCEDIYKDGIMAKETGKIVDAVSERLKRIYDDVTDDLINPFSFVDESINEDDLSSSSSSEASSSSSLSDIFALSTSPSASLSPSSSSSLVSSTLPVMPPPPPPSSSAPMPSLSVSPPTPPPPSSPSPLQSVAASSTSSSAAALQPPQLSSASSSSAFTPSLSVLPTPSPPSSSASASSPSTSSPSAVWAIDSHGQLGDKQKDEHVMCDKNMELAQEGIISGEVKVKEKVNGTKSTFDPNYFGSNESSESSTSIFPKEKFVLERENGEYGEFDDVVLEDFGERDSPLEEMEEVDSYELSLISQRAMENNSYKKRIKDLFASKFCSASRKWGYRLRGASDAKLEEKYMRERLATSAQGISPARGSLPDESDWEFV